MKYKIGQAVEVMDTDTPGEPIWCAGHVFGFPRRGKVRVLIDAGGITDASKDQIRKVVLDKTLS